MILLDADKYKKKGFERAYFDEVYRYLCKNKKYKTMHAVGTDCVMKELVWCLKEYKLLQFLVSEEIQDKTFDKLSEDNFKDIMKALILADAGTLRKMYNYLRDPNSEYSEARKVAKAVADRDQKNSQQESFNFMEYFGRNAYAGLRNLEISVPQVDAVKGTIPMMMVRSLEVRTCPYCNRAFIGYAKNKNIGVQLDHFYNKSDYPLFAVSLYNLIPCCSSCNMNKSNKDEEKLISPFEEGYSFDQDLKFVFERVQIGREGEESQVIRELQLNVTAEDTKARDRYKKNIDVFQLEASYEFHITEAKKFYDKMQAYPPSLLREIARHMTIPDEKGYMIERIPADVLELGLFQEFFCEPADYLKKPLAKFYRDLYYKYRGWS